MIHRFEYKSPVGELILASIDGKLCLADWKYRKIRPQIDKRILDFYKDEFVNETSEIIEQTIIQLEEYFTKTRTEFDIPLAFVGTEFQQRVWNELVRIPYGKTVSYLQLSQKLGDHKAIRAVATANGANGISILVPCHRVIGSDGSMVGYAGGLPAKKKLLSLEGSFYENLLF